MKRKIFYWVLAIVTVFSLVGCGKQKEPEIKNSDSINEPPISTNTTETQSGVEGTGNETIEEIVEKLPEEVIDEYQENLENVEVSEGRNMISFKQNDITTAIYYHDGEKITGYEAYIEYGSPELAATAKTAADLEDEENDVKSTTVEGSRLHVVFNENAYADTTLEEVKQAADAIQAIQNR